MKGSFIREGNLGQNPELKFIDDHRNEGDQVAICRFGVYFDYRVPTNDPDNPFEDKGGFWMDVEQWGGRGERIAKLLKKGCRVLVVGDQVKNEWVNDKGEEKEKLVIKATSVTLVLNSRVESIHLGERQNTGGDE